jgi:hypothetical protein
MAKNSFRIPKFVDHVIQDEGGLIVGTLRIKPSGVAWAPADGKKWRSISLERFVRFMEEHGKMKEK